MSAADSEDDGCLSPPQSPGPGGPPLSPSARALNSQSHIYKIVILGEGGVGKSALTMQFVSHSFLDFHDPTIEDAYQKQARIDGEPALLDILDTAGQVEFTAMRDQYMRGGEGFVLCYSITDRHSYDEIIEYKKQIQRVQHREDVPVVLVGNKYDLQEHMRQVAADEGKALAQQWDCPFYETSAALRHFVDDVFHALVREIRKRRRAEVLALERRNKKKNRGKRIKAMLTGVFKKSADSESESSSK